MSLPYETIITPLFPAPKYHDCLFIVMSVLFPVRDLQHMRVCGPLSTATESRKDDGKRNYLVSEKSFSATHTAPR